MMQADLPSGISPAEFTNRAVLWFEKVIEKVGPYSATVRMTLRVLPRFGQR